VKKLVKCAFPSTSKEESKNGGLTPGLRVFHVKTDALVGELNGEKVVLFALFVVWLLDLAADHT